MTKGCLTDKQIAVKKLFFRAQKIKKAFKQNGKSLTISGFFQYSPSQWANICLKSAITTQGQQQDVFRTKSNIYDEAFERK